MKIYHLKSCDSCQKAIKAIKAAGFDPATHDVRADGLSRETVQQLESELGFEALVNKRSTTWRGLEDSTKTELTRETAINLLVNNPTLMKRPVIEKDGSYTVGWTQNVQDIYVI